MRAFFFLLTRGISIEINPSDFVWLFAFDAVVLLLASLSGLLTLRSLVRTIRLYFVRAFVHL